MNDVTVVCRKELIAKCVACERLDREPTELQTPEDTRIAFTKLLNHLSRKHRYDAEAQGRIFDHTTDCQKCIDLDVIERGLRERDDRASDGVYGDHNLRVLDHEYTIHEVPHPDITNKDNYFKSITEVSRFTNPHFTKEIKAEVKRRTGNKCECCGRSWQDVETFDDERFYFETLLWQDIESLNDFKKLPELATKTLIDYRYATVTDGFHKNGKPRERIVQLFPETCKNCRAHLSWFIGFSNLKPIKASRWFQVHHKNFAHFDNRLENLEYLCGNCHGAKGRSRSDNATTNSHHGRDYVRNLLSYMKTRGITLSYIFLDNQESFSFALIGERQDH